MLHGGLHAVADQSAPLVQRRYLAGAVAERFPGFADVEYPDWRSFLTRLSAEAERAGWQGLVVLAELPYFLAADPTLAGVLQNWLDRPERRLTLAVRGSSQRMMHSAILDAAAPLYGRAAEAFAVRRLWFRVVAPHRAALAAAPRETRLRYWRRHRPSLESLAWEEQCRMAVPVLHRLETTLAGLGPWEPAQRYWWGNVPELDVVARSVDGRRRLVGEVEWSMNPAAASGAVARDDVGNPVRDDVGNLARAMDAEVCRALFVPPGAAPRAEAGVHVIDARAVMSVLR